LPTANYIGVFGTMGNHPVGERSSRIAPSTWLGAIPGGEHGPGRVVGIGIDPPNLHTDNFHNFSSEHAGAAHFLFADGSVTLVTHQVDSKVYQAFCTRAAKDRVGDLEGE
jgi:prepilin-type processing-associated H-X9-DG protein